MRVIHLLRHAKSSWADDTLADHERPLAKRGVRDAKRMAAHLLALHVEPDLVLCSPAARTRMTWHEVAVGLVEGGAEAQASVRYAAPLYESGVNAALGLIRAVDDEVETVLLVGHNPTVSALSSRLDDRSDRAAAGLRTSGIAVHTIEASWADLATAGLVESFTARG